jgi:hypothetical protein
MAGRISFALRLAAIPVLIEVIRILETRQPFAMFRLITFGAVFFLFADIASLLGGKWRDCILVLVSLALGIFLIEAAANIWEPREPTNRVVQDGFYAPRPVTGWGPAHAGRFHDLKTDLETGATIYSADYTIDSNLLRHTQSCENGPAVVFFGCSFAFGLGLNDADTLPQAFADSVDRKLRIVNLGYPSYGPHQFLSELQAGIFDSVIGPRPKLFVFETAAWHADRSACKAWWTHNAPRYIIENGRLILKGTCYDGLGLWLHEWLRSSAAYRWLVEPYQGRVNHDDIELYLQITRAAMNFAKAKYGVPVIVLYLGYEGENSLLQGTGFTTEAVLQRLREAGAVVVDASLSKESDAGMAVSIPGDGHPTALGNQLRVAILKNYLERHMPSVLAPSLN